MTAPLVPDFILKLFEKEVTKINLMIIEKMCAIYGIEVSEATDKMAKELKINFHIIDENIEQIKIVKKHHAGRTEQKNARAMPDNPNNPNNPNRDKSIHVASSSGDVNKLPLTLQHIPKMECCARVFVPNELLVKQCSRFQVNDGQFCKMHQQQCDNKSLKYGTIFDPKPECISTAKLNSKVRRKIY
jgi:hypothetical protein